MWQYGAKVGTYACYSLRLYMKIIVTILTCVVPENCTDGEVRLVGGQNEMEGRVEICYNGIWGAVCSRNWEYNEAAVVCRQLGSNPLGESRLCSLDNI